MCVDRECSVSSIHRNKHTYMYLWPERIFTVASRLTQCKSEGVERARDEKMKTEKNANEQGEMGGEKERTKERMNTFML